MSDKAKVTKPYVQAWELALSRNEPSPVEIALDDAVREMRGVTFVRTPRRATGDATV